MAWHDHNGGSCPVNPNATVRVKWANGTISGELNAGRLRWSRTGYDYDVAGYEVTSIEEVE